jgi:hypothetical protein
MATDNNNRFKFWCPVEIEKAIDETTGQEIMRLGGIASTADQDSDGEFLDPKGFDIRPLIESGMVNWHHQAKTAPATIVGEPSKAEIRKEGLYIETDLYPSSAVARDIWTLAQTLEKDSKTRRLGYSIEGKVVKRKSNDKKSPDYNKIVKAIITGVAITHQPKNPKTFANIIKGEIDDFDEEEEEKTEEKSLNTDNAAALKKESVDKKLKVTTFTKAEAMERLFLDIPGINITKAENIYLMLTKIANMAKRTKVNEEDIQKAYEALGLTDELETVSKARDDDDEYEDEENVKKREAKAKERLGGIKGDAKLHKEAEKRKMKKAEEDDDDPDGGDSEDLEKEKAKKAKLKKAKKAEDMDDEGDEEDVDIADEEEEDVDEDDDKEEKAKKTKMKKSQNNGGLFTRFDRIEKAISTSFFKQAEFMQALGIMQKASTQKLEKAIEVIDLAGERIEELLEINKAQEDTINMLSEKLEEYGSAPMPAKSIRHSAPVERAFSKGGDNDIEKGGEGKKGAVSIKNRPVISEILDQATFSKGFDEEFSKACITYEASGQLPANIIARVKNEFGIEIQ